MIGRFKAGDIVVAVCCDSHIQLGTQVVLDESELPPVILRLGYRNVGTEDDEEVIFVMGMAGIEAIPDTSLDLVARPSCNR